MNTETTTTTMSYFGWLNIRNVPCTIHPKRGELITAETLRNLEKQIALYLATSDAVLGGAEFQFLRKICGFSRAQIAEKFQKSEQTVINWEAEDGPLDVAYQAYMRAICLQQLKQHKPADEHLATRGPRPEAQSLIWDNACEGDAEKRKA